MMPAHAFTKPQQQNPKPKPYPSSVKQDVLEAGQLVL